MASNFFEQQDNAKKKSRLLVGAFLLSTLVIATIIATAILLVLNHSSLGDITGSDRKLSFTIKNFLIFSSPVMAFIFGASAFKIFSLRSGGGGDVAKRMHGTYVDPNTKNLQHRRYYNIVEEIAIASGVPVPEVYVMERERGINAFAAGYSYDDAAIAVTQGTLDALNREELQGVIAHEFSHVLNGDMRLNIRLMGVTFGLVALTSVGEFMTRRVPIIIEGDGRDNKSMGPVMAIIVLGFVFLVFGALGAFFAKIIKAAVSRQREYLADASAIQFTRNPDGIGGALKKIAAHSQGSRLTVGTSQVSHMLLGEGSSPLANIFRTHPPILDRIRAVDPYFMESDIGIIAEKLRKEKERQIADVEAKAEQDAQKKAAREQAAMSSMEKMAGGIDLNPANIAEQIGEVGAGGILSAAILLESMPNTVNDNAHDAAWSLEIAMFMLLSEDEVLREHQLNLINRRLHSPEAKARLAKLLEEPSLTPGQRLPTMEIMTPVLKRFSAEELEQAVENLQRIATIGKTFGPFAYYVTRTFRQAIQTRRGVRPPPTGNYSVNQYAGEVSHLLSIMSYLGHDENDAAAEMAFNAALEVIKAATEGEAMIRYMPVRESWPGLLDQAIRQLNRLDASNKEILVNAMLAAIIADEKVVAAEIELVRAICALLYVPVPLLQLTPESDEAATETVEAAGSVLQPTAP